MKLLVTGGAGFIGSNFVRYAIEKPEVEQLMVMDSITYAAQMEGVEELLAKYPSKFIFHAGDITDQGSVFKAFQLMKPTHIVHMAAETHVDRSINDPIKFFQTNVVGTANLLNVVRHYLQKELPNITVLSTDEVYGSSYDLLGSTSDKNGDWKRFAESANLNPTSPYAASKAGADMVCYSFANTYDVPIQILRPTNNYGPYQNTEKLIPKIISNALKNIDIPIYGDGKNFRDWLFVEDTCSGIWSTIFAEHYEFYITNLGADNLVSNIDIAQKILSLIPESKSKIKFVQDRLAHDRAYAVDSRVANKWFGWKPKTNLDDGLKKTIAWYQRCSDTDLGY